MKGKPIVNPHWKAEKEAFLTEEMAKAQRGEPSVLSAYLAEIGRKGGQKSRRKLTKAQARAMVRARTAKRAALRQNNKLSHDGR